MRVIIAHVIFFFCSYTLYAQPPTTPFQSQWKFRNVKDSSWHNAEVPGTIHTDLLSNGLIPDPFYGANESRVQWVEKEDWEYRTLFDAAPEVLAQDKLKLVFDGLDTYATVFLNGTRILSTDNMFRQWKADVKTLIRPKANELRIIFRSAVRHDDSLASIYPLKLAGENNRMFSRKAQYQYGWDWGPRLVTCGIWKPIHWELWDESLLSPKPHEGWNIKLVHKQDSAGESFYFTKDDQPVYIKGANWIPCESFIPRAVKKELYGKLIREAKEANINMLRVWGGGIYEDDIFYDLCDQYGIMVWQDFMFAGAMYPVDIGFFDNVEQEVRYQVERLKTHPCIAIWCGNNEIDEAWHNWGWQQQYGYSADDSARLWKGYERIFHELIPRILKELDPSRPYWPSSPSTGWGRKEAYSRGDVHYWGVWWGREPVEAYRNNVGRFNSEYGMQALPDMQTIFQFAGQTDLDTASVVMKAHQKHPFGYQNIHDYISNKFPLPKNFEDLVYVSQLMQADAIKTAIEAHRSAMPYNMGTMFWQWNDCWPVVSWSAVDYYGRKKALFYQVKRDFADDFVALERIKDSLHFTFQSAEQGKMNVMLKCFDRTGKSVALNGQVTEKRTGVSHGSFRIDTAKVAYAWIAISINEHQTENSLCIKPPKEVYFGKPVITYTLSGNTIEIRSDKLALGVRIMLPAGVEPSDNYFDLLPGGLKRVQLTGQIDEEKLKKEISFRSLNDTY
jgi:beta-mannosidase